MSFLVVRNLYIGIYIPFSCVQDGYQHHYMVFILGLIEKKILDIYFFALKIVKILDNWLKESLNKIRIIFVNFIPITYIGYSQMRELFKSSSSLDLMYLKMCLQKRPRLIMLYRKSSNKNPPLKAKY